MNKDEAFLSMEQGNRITHTYFDDKEYIFIDEKGRMYAEDGCRFEEGFKIRNTEGWQEGWSIYRK